MRITFDMDLAVPARRRRENLLGFRRTYCERKCGNAALDLIQYSMIAWLMDENAISHEVDMAEGHPMPSPLSGILRFFPSAMRSCFYTIDCVKSSEWACYDSCSSMTGSIEYSPQYSMAYIPLKMAHLWYNRGYIIPQGSQDKFSYNGYVIFSGI